ncbi:MAG: ABC transporter permease [Candidatus Eisenbacteria bacterium]|uniref:ABC transporter permease n=1 Tax=Eiseniibacteriota bacterium TaxID=2212470 RepID=A0A849SKD2_UNCEI|nr:ABC transporter permease [Candidatus Eisenbacteria bacterium]
MIPATPYRRATPAWLVVMRWEVLRILRQPTFVVSLLITPLLAVGTPWLISKLGHRNPPRVAVAWTNTVGEITETGPHALARAQHIAWVPDADVPRDTVQLKERVASGKLAGALLVPADYAEGGEVRVWVKRGAPGWAGGLAGMFREDARAARAARLGLPAGSLEALDADVSVELRPLSEGGSTKLGGFLIVFGILMLMMMVVFSSISYLIAGIGAEKQARVTEVVVSAIPPQAWMDGKILGFTVIGLLMAVVWGASLLVAAVLLRFPLPSGVQPGVLAVTLVFATCGLYLYNAMFAGIMASIRSMQSSSGSQTWFFMLPFAPFFLLDPLRDDPDAAWLAVATLIPPLTPSMVPVRLVMQAITWWEVVLALGVLIGACFYMRRAAGRIFRLGMLLYGKDMTMPEILRWMREKD